MTEIRPTASDVHIGGQTISVSMLGTWWQCPRLWYWRYRHTSPTGELGLEPLHTASPLVIGSAVHLGLAAYYLSGKEGDWQLEAALSAARQMFDERSSEFESEERWAADLAETERILRGYVAEYGAEGRSPEWPNFRPIAVEQTYAVLLRTGDTLSVRPDMLAENFGMLVAVEHKVPGAARISPTIGAAALGAQGLAQAAILRYHDVPNNGMLLNIAVRGDYRRDNGRYTSPSKPFQRHVIPVDSTLLVPYILDLAAESVLQIRHAVQHWNTLRDDGMSDTEAAHRCFPMSGLFSGQCFRGWSPCDMANLCKASGREAAQLVNYRVRSYKPETTTNEE